MTTKCIFTNIRGSSVAGLGSRCTLNSIHDCPNTRGNFTHRTIYKDNRDETKENVSHDENNTSE